MKQSSESLAANSANVTMPVGALYKATDGKPNQWRMLAGLDGATADAIEFAVARGWLLIERGYSVCLTDAGRHLAEKP